MRNGPTTVEFADCTGDAARPSLDRIPLGLAPCINCTRRSTKPDSRRPWGHRVFVGECGQDEKDVDRVPEEADSIRNSHSLVPRPADVEKAT